MRQTTDALMMARRTTAEYICLARVKDAKHVDSAISVNTRVCSYFLDMDPRLSLVSICLVRGTRLS